MPNGARPKGPRQGRCAPAVGRRWVGGASALPIVPRLALGTIQLSTDERASLRQSRVKQLVLRLQNLFKSKYI